MIRILVASVLCMGLARVTSSPARYDQRQSGKYNIRVALKEVKIMTTGFSGSDIDGDYDISNYDYEDPTDLTDISTGKPPSVNATSGWAVVNSTSVASTTTSTITTTTEASTTTTSSPLKEYTPYDVIVTTKRPNTKYDPSKRMRCRAGYYKDHAGRCRRLRGQQGIGGH